MSHELIFYLAGHNVSILCEHIAHLFFVDVVGEVLDVDICKLLGFVSEDFHPLTASHEFADKPDEVKMAFVRQSYVCKMYAIVEMAKFNLHFLSIQQHAVHLFDGIESSFFRLKMDKSITLGAILIHSNLENCSVKIVR